MEHGSATLLINLDHLPRFGGVEVGVYCLCAGHCAAQSRSQLNGTDLGCSIDDGCIDQVKQGLVFIAIGARFENLRVTTLVRHGQDPVHQVAPGGHQLFIHSAGDLSYRYLGVRLLGEGSSQCVANGVGLELIQSVLDGEPNASTSGSLAALEGDVLIGRYVGRQVEAAIGH